jgi:hypothetical protein
LIEYSFEVNALGGIKMSRQSISSSSDSEVLAVEKIAPPLDKDQMTPANLTRKSVTKFFFTLSIRILLIIFT